MPSPERPQVTADLQLQLDVLAELLREDPEGTRRQFSFQALASLSPVAATPSPRGKRDQGLGQHRATDEFCGG
jgi:hypothetical protein